MSVRKPHNLMAVKRSYSVITIPQAQRGKASPNYTIPQGGA